MAKDSKFVSAELHEIKKIAAKFNAPEPLVFYIQDEMARNAGTYTKRPVFEGKQPVFYKPAFRPGKVFRTQFYSVLEAMGYKK
jgi:hypothetical protein